MGEKGSLPGAFPGLTMIRSRSQLPSAAALLGGDPAACIKAAAAGLAADAEPDEANASVDTISK